MNKHPSIRTIDQVLKADLCLGCGACQYAVPGKIELKMNAEGYLRPVVQQVLQPAEEELALSVCPGIHVEHTPPLKNEELMWGPIKSCQAGWSTDDQLRHKASSGGGLSAFAGHMLRSGQADAVLHIGVSAHDPLLNEYRISTTPEQVAGNAGSRYAPAAPLTGLREALAKHERIAFIGKPCDVVAMRKIMAVDPVAKQKVVACLSFMCAGVPSIKGTHAVLNKLNSPREEVVEFRYRGNGWPGLATAVLKDGRSRSMTYDDSWGKILNKHLQFRCKVCFDGTGEFADITCADAWYGSRDGYPSFEEAQGRSLILARTGIGAQILADAIEQVSALVESLPSADLPKIQPYQRDRKLYALSRWLALKAKMRAAPFYSFQSMFLLTTKSRPLQALKNFLGTLRRI